MPQLFPTPYINPEILKNASTGISWDTIPSRNSTPAQQLAEQWNICRRASAMIDTEVNQRLRATVSNERLLCPDYRVTVLGSTGVASIMLARVPVLEILSGQWAYNNPPLTWNAIPGNAFEVNQPSPGVYGSSSPGDAAESGQTVTLGAGYITWWNGRKGQFLQVTYISGFPHCSLTANAPAGATSVPVDDVTGWAPQSSGLTGASGNIRDAGNEETVGCLASSALAGSGTLSLASPLAFAHQSGTIMSALPEQLVQAAILFAVSQALVRGATATGVQSMSGGMIHGDGPQSFAAEAELLCKAYRRVT